MRASLRDAQNSQTLSFPLSFHSGIGRKSGEKEGRTDGRKIWNSGLWFTLRSALSGSLLANSGTELKDEDLYEEELPVRALEI